MLGSSADLYILDTAMPKKKSSFDESFSVLRACRKIARTSGCSKRWPRYEKLDIVREDKLANDSSVEANTGRVWARLGQKHLLLRPRSFS